MRRLILTLTLVGLVPAAASAQDFVNVKGKFVFDAAKAGKAAPAQVAIKPTKDEEVCLADKEGLNTEDWIVNPKTGGVANVVVWLVPEPTAAQLADLQSGKIKELPVFDKKDIHPTLAVPSKQVEIDQPCCRFIPHVLCAQVGQEMLIKNSATVPHNAKWTSRNNLEINPLIPAGGEYRVTDPNLKVPHKFVAERFPIEITCSIHPWMKAWVRVFDHPYFAVTDKEGNFVIKNVPVLQGKLRLLAWHEDGGQHGGVKGKEGTPIAVAKGDLDLKEIKLDAKPSK